MNTFANLRSRIARSDDERGAILVLTALVMLLLLFIAAFSTDLGAWYRQTEEQQRAADVGALNGIQSFDRTARATFPAGITRWEDLNPADAANAEDAGFREAVRQVQALLETSGLTFSNAATFSFALDPNPVNPDPGNPGQWSTATLTADDGSIITIRRGWAESGVDLNGNPVYSRVVEVVISRQGEQYFSNILRDAPTIERAAQSIISNCGAVCGDEVVFNPPFTGFKGTGNGDGFAPLLYDRSGDGNVDEAWAVNHHSNGVNIGQIICVEFETQQACPGSTAPNQAYALDYQTSNRPVEYFDEVAGQIYYAARDDNSGALGLACFSVVTKQNCTNQFIKFWDQPGGASYPSWINATGPFEFDDRLYIIAQDGQIGCATLTLQPCRPGPNNGVQPTVAGTDTSNLPDLNTGNLVTSGEQNGSTLIATQNGVNGLLFRCLNLSNPNGVTGCGQHWADTLGNGGDDNETFERFDTAGNSLGVCVLHILTHENVCVDWNAGNPDTIPAMSTDLTALKQSWGGDTFTWEKQRTFFAGGNANTVACWDWTVGDGRDGQACDDGPEADRAILTTDDAFTGFGNAQPYGFNQISARCVLGLGHQAVFFSFDPVGYGPCVDVKISKDIEPCRCEDSSAGFRWGAITLPASLLNDVDFLEGSATFPDGTPFSFNGSTTVDLLATGGVIDLSPLNELANPPAFITLTLDADSKVVDGNVVFDDDVLVALEITTQPTLNE